VLSRVDANTSWPCFLDDLKWVRNGWKHFQQIASLLEDGRLYYSNGVLVVPFVTAHGWYAVLLEAYLQTSLEVFIKSARRLTKEEVQCLTKS
jgi:hypothetical protein